MELMMDSSLVKWMLMFYHPIIITEIGWNYNPLGALCFYESNHAKIISVSKVSFSRKLKIRSAQIYYLQIIHNMDILLKRSTWVNLCVPNRPRG